MFSKPYAALEERGSGQTLPDGLGAAAGRPWSTAAIAPPSTTALPVSATGSARCAAARGPRDSVQHWF